jgi:DUF1680 family protein
MKKPLIIISSFLCFLLISVTEAQTTPQKMEPVYYSQIRIEDNFWKPRINTVSSVSIPVLMQKAEMNIHNFEKVVDKKGEKADGLWFTDSDLYKVLEAIGYSLKNNPDPELEKKSDLWIDKIAAAQLPDGYLNTYFQLGRMNERWSNMGYHETYCAGHLIEAAIAYYNTTGKRKLLDVSIRFANHIDSTFRQQNRHWVTGHEEIELALVKLYRTTGDKKYLELADWFLEQRGNGYRPDYATDAGHSREWYDEYLQDYKLREQTKVRGHAVRAMYLYTGATDVEAAKSDSAYMPAIKKIWEDVLYRNMYITGAIGSSSENEGFSHNYDLPDENAYAETCASIGMVFWNHRLNIITGESKYADILERSLYNGALDGLSLSGDKFFYRNPLASSGAFGRGSDLHCCSSNITRLVESVGNYIYAKSDNALWVNLFIANTASVVVKNRKVQIRQVTDYPWDGKVRIFISPEKQTEFELYIRIPGWAKNQPVPGDAYHFADNSSDKVTLSVNGIPTDVRIVKGYAVIRNKWKKGDMVLLDIPMPVRRILANDQILENHNRIALQRGPLIYCFEYADNNGKAMNIVLPDNIKFTPSYKTDLLDGIVVLEAEAPVATISADGSAVNTEIRKIKAIPYYSWANRGNGQMQVWMPRTIADVRLLAQ